MKRKILCLICLTAMVFTTFFAVSCIKNGGNSSDSSDSGATTIEEIILDEKSVLITLGETHSLRATDGENTLLCKWSSSNEKVATVSSGKVTGISEGTATITVKSSNGKTATCEVKITPIEATSVRLSKTLATLYIGDTLELKATINPTNIKKILFISKNIIMHII